MGDSYNESSNLWRDAIRGVFAFLDRPAYWLLGLVYQLFFNVASADIFSNNTIMKFYGRVQVILGVFMMFQLAMTILRGIIEPDSFSKEKGGGSLIRRVAISLMLITVLMPISVGNPRNEYEKQLNNNGLLFGTLYSLQHRILSNNTLGRLVLGTTEDKSTYISADDEDELQKSSRIFTSTILKGFYRINLVPESERVDTGTKDPATVNKNRMCQDIDDEVMKAYTRIDAEPGEIISMVNETCEPTFNLVNHIPLVSSFGGTKKYMINYMPFISMIVAIVFVFILLSFTIDVAVRAVKLAILRLVAPIPIIAYMDPKGSGDEAFKSWGKVLVSTYLDLFIRLAVVYFVIFIIQDMIVNGIVIEHGTGVLGVLSLIVIWIGLFVFAKQAPKFIRQVLGLKGDPGKLFSGFSELGSAVGMGASAVGAVGSGIASAKASRMADETRRSMGENVNPDSFWNKGKHFLAGIAGGAAGGAAGVKAAWGAKDHGFRSAMEAQRKYNAEALQRGDAGATRFGQMASTAKQIFTGEGLAAQTDRDIANLESRQKALDAIKSRVSGEMVKKDWTFGAARRGHVDTSGSSLDGVLFNYKNFTSEMEKSKAAGLSTVSAVDNTGRRWTIDYAVAERMKGQLLQSNEDNYVKLAQQATFTAADGTVYTDQQDSVLVGDIRDAMAKGGSGWDSASKTYDRKRHNHINSRDDYTKSSDGLGQDILNLKRKNTTAKANDLYSGKKS